MPVFEIIIVEHPTKDDKDAGKLERIIFGPEVMIAANQDAASMSILWGDKRPQGEWDPDRAEVLVRPFA